MGRIKQNKLTKPVVEREYKKLENKNELINLEQFYVNGKLENLEQLVEMKKKELVKKLEDYQEIMKQPIYNDNGELIDTVQKAYNPYLVSTYFFKTINPLTNIEPEYSSEKLAIVWNLYMYLIEQVNINIGVLQPTISHFCRFAGISVSKFKTWKNRGTLEMQTLLNKISDETFNGNVALAQNRMLSDRSTALRVKVENEVQEKPQVHVNVNVNEDIDLDSIASRLHELSNFKNIKNNMKEPIEVEKYGED